MPAEPTANSDRLPRRPRSAEPTLRLEHPALRAPRAPSGKRPATEADFLQLLAPPDITEIRRHERVMAELLVGAQQEKPRRLSRLAEEAVGGSLSGMTSEGLVAVALALRDRCVALGMPACRYREPDWRQRGMPMESAGGAG